MSRIKSRYLPEMDGLRALAIAAVLLFHLSPSLLTGGFLGVDVFFVISGFLITRLILPQVAEGRFSFRQFYVRRAKRLLPVFLLTLVLTWVAAWWLLFPDLLTSLSRATFAAVLSFSNYEFAKKLDYFAPVVVGNPLLHTWSLAVEEQFYLAFPLLMVKTWRPAASVRSRLGWMAAIVTALFVLSWVISIWRPSYAFYALESRAWELGIGCFTAILADKIDLGRRMSWVLSWVGGALCVAAFVLLSESSGLPAPMALIPTLGAALLILSRCGGEGSVTYHIATLSPLRYLGRISYSLYLFHWPVIVFYKVVTPGWQAPDQALCAAISIVLAMLVHHTLENPVRHTSNPALLRKLGYAGLAVIITLGVGSKGVRYAGGYVGARCERWLLRVHPESGQRKPPALQMTPIGVRDKPAELVLIGDSHAQCLVPVLDEALREKGRSGAYWIALATMPVLDVQTSTDSAMFAQILPEIARGSARVVVFCSSWPTYIIDPNESVKNHDPQAEVWRNQWFHPTPRVPVQLTGHASPSEARKKPMNERERMQETYRSIQAGMTKTIQMLTQAGKRVILVHPIPPMDRQVSKYMASMLMTGQPLEDVLTTPEKYLESTKHIFDLLGQMRQLGDVRPVYPHELMNEAGRLPYRAGEQALYEDNNHVTRLGAQRIVPGILSAAWP